MMMKVPTQNRMVPNSRRTLSTSFVSSDTPIDSTSTTDFSPTTTTGTGPSVHPDDPNLYVIPSALSPVYKSLPFQLRVVVAFISTYIFASRSFILQSTWELLKISSQIGLEWWFPIRFIRMLLSNSAWGKRQVFLDLLKVLIKSYLLYTVSTVFVQDVALQSTFSPSRISMSELMSKYHTLPSTYSKYHGLITDYNLSDVPYEQKVHFLKAIGTACNNKNSTLLMDAIYVNHGFGASSLSWLPVIPELLPYTIIVLGHDAPGFGCTDRSPKNDYQHSSSSYYSLSNSATIGSTLLRNHIPVCVENDQTNANANILLMGHSLGSLTTLRMALQQQQNNTKLRQHIILVSPAVGLRGRNKKDKTSIRLPTTTTLPNNQVPLPRIGRRYLFEPLLLVQRPLQRIGTSIACYGIKRLVGQANFWRNGLQQFVWNSKNPKYALRDSDVLRYQWPAIVQDWEIGLVQFASAQATHRPEDSMSDIELIQAVLDLPTVSSIHVIVGSNDRVIPNSLIVKFFQDHFPNRINVTTMDGFGHNPFEEDPEMFVESIRSLLPVQS